MTTNVAIGTPQYGGKKKNNSRLVDGDNVYRILPPLFELASEGVWAVYECLHWGFKGSKGMRPFRCIQKKDFKTKMVKVQCPECDQIAQRVASKEALEAKLAAEGKTKEQIAEQLKPLTDWLFSHNLDKKWYVNALAADNKITRLAIPHKMYTQLQEVINGLVSGKSNGGVPVDPIGVDGGVWFNMIRSGKGNQTSHRVEVVTETVMADVGGRKVPLQQIKAAPLTQDILQRLGNDAHDLKNSFRSLVYEEIKRLVNSGGDPEVVDAVFSSGDIQPTAAVAEPDVDEPEPGARAGTTNNAALKEATPPASAVVTSAPVAVDTTAAMAAMRAEIEAKLRAEFASKTNTVENLKVSDFKAPVSVAPAETPKAPAAATLSDDEFIKSFGFSANKS